MASMNRSTAASKARVIFDRIKASLEATSPNKFVAVEPISGEFFLGETLSDAIGSSRRQHPDRLAHAFRVGHKATVHFGLHI